MAKVILPYFFLLLSFIHKCRDFFFIGMGIVAEKYPDDKDRSKAMGIALGGSAVGVLGKDNPNLCSLLFLLFLHHAIKYNKRKSVLL